MTNIVQFPGRAVPTAPELPPNSPLADQLEAAELALIRAQTAQLKAMTREVNAAWFAACFRRLVFWGVVAWLLYALASPAAADPSRSFYDGQGRFAGSSLERGNQTTFYDNAGRFSGSVIQHGKQRSFYGPRGNFTGSSIERR
jgi:YD repeat-containing protein